MKSIAVINCWLGPYPNYWGMWLKSVAFNPSVQFFIIGDTCPPLELPSNCRYIHISLEEMQERARKRLGEPEAIIPNAYKICDYRPMFGNMFSDLLEGYDFWGHCDQDLLFGDIRHFMTEDKLDAYDKLCPIGHFSLYKNTHEINMRWKLPYAKFDYRTVIKSPMFFAFDEWDGIYNIYMKCGFPFYRKVDFANLVPYVRRFRFRQRSNPKYERYSTNYDYQAFYWEDGHFFRAFLENKDETVKTEEMLYIHFFKRQFPTPAQELVDIGHGYAFWCSPAGFFEKTNHGVPSVEEVKMHNPFPGKLFEKCEDYWYRKKYKLLSIFKGSFWAPKELKIPGSSFK